MPRHFTNNTRWRRLRDEQREREGNLGTAIVRSERRTDPNNNLGAKRATRPLWLGDPGEVANVSGPFFPPVPLAFPAPLASLCVKLDFISAVALRPSMIGAWLRESLRKQRNRNTKSR